MKHTQPQKHEVHLKKQIKVTISNTVYTINHIYAGTRTVKEMYESLIERKLKNL